MPTDSGLPFGPSATDPSTLEDLGKLIRATTPPFSGSDRAVLGEGPVNAVIAFVGEQPGDQEDLAGRPFVGPAGHVLDRAMAESGIDRTACYLTNAVKHFKYEQRGKRRLHQSPTAGEIKHYRWWLMKELDLVAPRIVVALGGSAAGARAGKSVSVLRNRGAAELSGRTGFITVHPSYILRLREDAAKEAAYLAFVADLKQLSKLAEHP